MSEEEWALLTVGFIVGLLVATAIVLAVTLTSPRCF